MMAGGAACHPGSARRSAGPLVGDLGPAGPLLQHAPVRKAYVADVGRQLDPRHLRPARRGRRRGGVRRPPAVLGSARLAPKANAYAERWVQTVRSECLDWMLVLGRHHLLRLLPAHVRHYNHEHRHSGIGLHTPASVHHGTAESVRRARQATLDAAWAAHPERFTRRPTAPRIPNHAWINRPDTSVPAEPVASRPPAGVAAIAATITTTEHVQRSARPASLVPPTQPTSKILSHLT